MRRDLRASLTGLPTRQGGLAGIRGTPDPQPGRGPRGRTGDAEAFHSLAGEMEGKQGSRAACGSGANREPKRVEGQGGAKTNETWEEGRHFRGQHSSRHRLSVPAYPPLRAVYAREENYNSHDDTGGIDARLRLFLPGAGRTPSQRHVARERSCFLGLRGPPRRTGWSADLGNPGAGNAYFRAYIASSFTLALRILG
ncbi:hypothetical protein P7K49_001376 [Saguinus oedipus]|uniref:Uncharacterized protein n=1 Tax=Saguinus oedipus TaxID=9490 RepID=A0ABQ9WEA7_SAGOE|nr:hypothetical protein P7K49_001376 [Saguinus oedipus]